jgi:hypothetical protein
VVPRGDSSMLFLMQRSKLQRLFWGVDPAPGRENLMFEPRPRQSSEDHADAPGLVNIRSRIEAENVIVSLSAIGDKSW